MRHANASHVVTANNRFKYNGKEDQTVGAFGLLDYGARMYDAQIGRWLAVDPLADSYYPISPYVYCANNPMFFTDPNGMWLNPIYDEFGNFMGTDDRGLQGKPFFIKKALFTQGMNHEVAEFWNMGAEVLGDEALLKYLCMLFNNTLYIDASKLNFGNLSVNNIPLKEGVQGNVNLLEYVDIKSLSSTATTYALGNTQMKLVDKKNGRVKLFEDKYDWDFHHYPLEKG